MTVNRWGHIEGFSREETEEERWARVAGLRGDALTVDKVVEGGEKAPRRLLRKRIIQDGERTYHAYSADELIEIDSLANHGRPGMPF